MSGTPHPHPVAIRDAGAYDAEAVAGVLCRALQAAYLGAGDLDDRGRLAALEPDDLREGAAAVVARAAGDDWTVVADRDGEVVGFLRLRVHPTPDRLADGEVASLYVDPPAWGTGGGDRLLDHGLAALRDRGCGRVWLWVAAENERAQGFYRRHGLVPDGARRTYPMRVWGVDLGFSLDVVRYARELPTEPDHTEKTDRRHTGGTPAMDRRHRKPRPSAWHLTAVIAVLGLLLAACDLEDLDDPEATGADEEEEVTVGEEDDADDPDAPDDAPDDAPAEGGTVTVARSADVDNLDPHLATAFQSRQALELIYETLTEFDEDLEVVDGLAEEWEFSEDGLTLTFDLREGVQFHNGEAFGADDVVATVERLTDPDSGAVAGINFAAVESVEAVDDATVEISLSEPDVSLLAAFADANAAIVQASALEEGTVEDDPVGTGAFAFDQWQQGEAFALTANEDYYRDGPYVDGVEIRVEPEQASIAAAMQAGSYHVAVLEDPNIVLTLPEDEFDIQRPDALAYHTLMLNQDVEPFDQLEVRQAIACAVDRQGVVDSAALGEGRVTGPFTAPEWQFDAHAGLPCDAPDPEAAQDLLAEAGYEDGLDAEMIINADGYANAVAEAQTLEAQLSEVGINLELDVLESGVYVDRWVDVDFDIALARNGGRPDPHHMYARYFHSDGDLNDVATHSSDELDELIDAGRSTEDPDERQEIYQELSETLVEEAPWTWMYTGFEYRVVQPQVEGFTALSDGSLRMLRETQVSG